jgi:putative FmdB family regulatory protein
MPTYEYRCKSCSHQFDVVQSFTDDALTTCPECGEATLKKVFGNVGITFKGSGFYKTDSRSAGSFGSTKDADRSDTGSSSSTTPAKTDSTSSSTKDGGTSSTSSSPTTTPAASSSTSSTSTTPA